MPQQANNNILSFFHPALKNWFENTFEAPTPAQLKGWPSIFKKNNTLILAPTGSGKTLSAFLVCIDELLEKLAAKEKINGVHTLYISPLKALNYDIERNLEVPLNGIQKAASKLNLPVPGIQVAVRTGDTPQKERRQMIKQPPHILITTPESLHLLLTSKQPREILRTIKYVIVDEIHALSENKRGTFLSILLERLQNIADNPFVRIGLSATQKPLEEIAKFLGGYNRVTQDDEVNFNPRPVTIVDAGMRKKLDLRILSPVEDFKSLPGNTIWFDIYQKLLELIQNHRSTLIFANNRATVERITAEINERAGFELAKAHHGSVFRDLRRQIEEELKRGKLAALVATATLELGIDMGAIDLVCQVESPKSVARGLQRVGRAGHVYKSASKGRLLPKTRSDLLEMTVITRAMRNGDVAPIKIPTNCLDILAQQIVALTAMKSCKVDDIYNLIRQAYPYQKLPWVHFLSVIEMISGRYPADTFRDLKPRVSWDIVNNVLHPLPGTQRAAIMGGGAIPDTGQFGCYLEDGVTKIGELEEEFIYERRTGEVFVLGTSNWRIKEITYDRVIVTPAPGEPARMPLWKGEFYNRSFYLGKQLGKFCREFSNKLNDPDCSEWLQQEFFLDNEAAENLYQYVLDQKQKSGTIPDDRTILVESFPDEMGDFRFVLLSPFGGKIHLPWKLAILAQFRRQLNLEPESYHSDTGLIFRYPMENPDSFLQILKSVNSENVEELIIEELANSSFFGLRFRQNAGRALLMPLFHPGKRAPLWLQRMRARDLLEVARLHPSFPIVVETYRESLQDFLALDELKKLLHRIEAQEIKLVVNQARQPSPFASSLMFEFTASYMYEYDQPKQASHGTEILDKYSLDELLHPDRVNKLLDSTAMQEFEKRLQAEQEGYRARTPAELVELLYKIGDLTEEEISTRVNGDWKLFIDTLLKEKRIIRIVIPQVEHSWRWITAEDFPLYREAFADKNANENSPESYKNIFLQQNEKNEALPQEEFFYQKLLTQKISQSEAQSKILERYLQHHTLTTIDQIRCRYPFDELFIRNILNEFQTTKSLVKIPQLKEEEPERWAFRETVERIRRITIRQQRSNVQPCDTAQFVEFLLRWQHRTQSSNLNGIDGVAQILEQLQGLFLPAKIWENEILARRVKDYLPGWLDELSKSGDIVWRGIGARSSSSLAISFTFRENMPYLFFKPQLPDDSSAEKENTTKLRQILQKRGACFLTDLSIESGLSPSGCSSTLWEMIKTGEISNDTFAVIRAGKRTISSSTRNISHYQLSGFSAGKRLGGQRGYRSSAGIGRWFLLPSHNEENLTSEILEFLTRQLLQRYGLICRELYNLEAWQIPWRQIYKTLIRLEWRGEIRRGYFVKGLSGVQFAVPASADELMSLQKRKSDDVTTSRSMILINTWDPANLYGAASPLALLHPLHHDWRLTRHPNNYLILKNGLPILAIEAKGARLIPLRDLSNDEKQQALSLLPQLLDESGGWRNISSIKVEYWDDQPVRNSEVADILKEIGFRDEFKLMVLERMF